MCGIIGYTGDAEATPILIAGLRALEYRGYDSAGIALAGGGRLRAIKSVGRIDALAEKAAGADAAPVVRRQIRRRAQRDHRELRRAAQTMRKRGRNAARRYGQRAYSSPARAGIRRRSGRGAAQGRRQAARLVRARRAVRRFPARNLRRQNAQSAHHRAGRRRGVSVVGRRRDAGVRKQAGGARRRAGGAADAGRRRSVRARQAGRGRVRKMPELARGGGAVGISALHAQRDARAAAPPCRERALRS